MEFNYDWTIVDAIFTKDKGKVFSCFACGGGSSWGYKLAGFDVLGCNEIDKKMIEVYRENHKPKYSFLESIQQFKLRRRLSEVEKLGQFNIELGGGYEALVMPEELYDLDILDGSPPCSSFSMAGNRESDWGKEKVFREGQAEQVLDTLFFDFIELGKELQPKIIVAENVEGLLMGEARAYVRRIYTEMDEAGYYVQHWLLNASEMGVPQRRSRVFFIALRKNLAEPFLVQKDMFTMSPDLKLDFCLPGIPFGRVFADYTDRNLPPKAAELWKHRLPEDTGLEQASERISKKNHYFQWTFLKNDKVANTILANDCMVLYDYPRPANKTELCRMGSYPSDYNFLKVKPQYLIGMSVPPIMVAQIADQLYKQWISKFPKPEPKKGEPKKYDISELEKERLAWSLQTFPEATDIAGLNKALGEIEEIREDILLGKRRPEEYADTLMCLFDSAARQKEPITIEEILEAYANKIKINKSRSWVKNPDNTYSHVKNG